MAFERRTLWLVNRQNSVQTTEGAANANLLHLRPEFLQYAVSFVQVGRRMTLANRSFR